MFKKKAPCHNKLRPKLRSEWCELDLSNKILLLIGIVLLFELIFSIFLKSFNGDATTDAFFRLALSSVLGYFLGINVGNGSPQLAQPKITPKPISTVEQTESKPLDSNTNAEYTDRTANIRTLFISFVCLACIITLSITTFYSEIHYEEGLIQLRNIISTTVGFLISKANRVHS